MGRENRGCGGCGGSGEMVELNVGTRGVDGWRG